MGNDQSHLSGIEIEQKSVEISDFWSHHSATISSDEKSTNLSVLISELFVEGPLWKTHTPLQKTSKHLMIYRHPCILKYISSWQKHSKFYLAVEEATPLSRVLAAQSTLQICIGLHSILKALIFLHEKAYISHNNVCISSIYVTRGNWKLAGMEYACKFSELSSDYLKKTNTNRCNKSVDPNEEKHIQGSSRRDFVDIFAYGVLVCEILKSKTDGDIPSLTGFREMCKNDLQSVDVAARPKLSSLLDHDFFNHDFIIIHSFLIELPLKSDEEKTNFFQSLAERLRAFPEGTVATQLGNLLLSRLVLLNKAAQEELLPFILCPKDSDDSRNLFSIDTFRKYLSPKVLEIFCVRDAQIRLLLLNYFKFFVQIFTKEELQTCILPELLVGVKDTNDHLVSITLRTLADLVPILGAATVIGGKRGKLFTDGRPVAHPSRRRRNSRKPEQVLISDSAALPERPRPDGEEVETSTEENEQSVEEDLDNWEDWGESNPVIPEAISVRTNSSESVASVFEVPRIEVLRKSLPDINELDIKNQTGGGDGDDFDFFQDMEPVIEASAKFVVEEKANSKLDVAAVEGNEDGWGEEEW